MFKEKLHCGSSFASSDLLAAYSHHIQAPGAYSVVISDVWLAANTVVLLLEKGKVEKIIFSTYCHILISIAKLSSS